MHASPQDLDNANRSRNLCRAKAVQRLFPANLGLRLLLSSLLCGLALAGVAGADGVEPPPAGQSAEVQRLSALGKALEETGLPAAVRAARDPTTPAPLIHSDFGVRQLAKRDPELAKLEQARRELGRKFLVALEVEAKRLQTPASSAERELAAAALLELGDWLRQAPGYGNYILVTRCEDLVAVPLTYLVADLGYPLARVEAMMKRLLTPEQDLKMRLEALNGEAPEPFALDSRAPVSDRNETLHWMWGQKTRRVFEWRTARQELTYPMNQKTREQLPAELACYSDDVTEHPPLATTLAMWDQKWHQSFLGGRRDVNVGNLEALLLFRQKVGHFPTKPVYTDEELRQLELQISEAAKQGVRIMRLEEAHDSLVVAGFAQAWEPFRREYGPIYVRCTQE